MRLSSEKQKTEYRIKERIRAAKEQRHRVFLYGRSYIPFCLCSSVPLCLSIHLKKQSQLGSYCVLRIAKMKNVKQSQLLNSIDNRGRDALGTRGRACPERSRRDVRDTSGAYGENFAEQSQFAPSLMGSTSFIERCYDDTAHPETTENKANFPAQLVDNRGQACPERSRGDALVTRGRDARDTIRSTTSP